jgi:hypothetical protein
MSKRKIDLDVKVQAMLECLQLHNVEEVVHKYGLSKRVAYYWFEKIKDHLPEILEASKPGRKVIPPEIEAPPRQQTILGKR